MYTGRVTKALVLSLLATQSLAAATDKTKTDGGRPVAKVGSRSPGEHHAAGGVGPPHQVPPDWSAMEPSRDLVYHDCYGGRFKCARLLVPLNWLDGLDPRTAAIAIVTRPARVPANNTMFGGSILINPGGPGSSGADFAHTTAETIQEMLDTPLYRHYEIVGFDPRGAGSTTPSVRCAADPRQSAMWETQYRGAEAFNGIGRNSTLTRSGMAYALAINDALNRECYGEALAKGGAHEATTYTSTPNVARDMLEMVDRIEEHRRREFPDGYVGQNEKPQLQYLGFSYGTYLGATFASMFPDRVGRMALDGVVEADDYASGKLLKATAEADTILHNFFLGCFRAGIEVCPLAFMKKKSLGSQSAVFAVNTFHSWVEQLDKEPIVVRGKSIVITGNDIRRMVASVTFKPTRTFRVFARFLHAAMTKDADGLVEALSAFDRSSMGTTNPMPALPPTTTMSTGNDTFHRKQDGRAGGGGERKGMNFQNGDHIVRPRTPFDVEEAKSAVICADGDDFSRKSVSWWVDYMTKQSTASKVFGRVWPLMRVRCYRWPFKSNWRYKGPFMAGRKEKLSDPGAPLLFITSRFDPVTPWASARKMSKKFPGSRVIGQNSLGHTALGSGTSRCMRSVLSNYFEKGILPKRVRLECPVDCDIWKKDCPVALQPTPVVPAGLGLNASVHEKMRLDYHVWPLRVPYD